MIVILGATGNTGKVIAEKLLAAGEKVRVVGRNAQRLEGFAAQGAEAFVGSADDPALMERAFAGATAVYAMIPPNITIEDYRSYQERISDVLAAAIEKARVSHVVNLSSFGADKSEKVGPVNGLHSFEQKLNRIAAANVLHLRPGYFMENYFQYMGLIRTMGMIAGTLRGDLPISMIATRDIGVVAAEALRQRNFSGKTTREVLGPRDVSMNEGAQIIGRAIGKERLGYSRVPALMVKPAMRQAGIAAGTADLLLEMFEAMNSGWMAPQEKRSATNSTPTTLETFAAEELAPRFQAAAAGAH